MLSQYDQLGINDELVNYETLLGLGFKDYVSYVNPVYVPSLWKREVGKGPDLILKIGEFTFYVEEKFCSRDYPYRKAWFLKTVVPRFEKYPCDYFHRRIVLTNRPDNYNSVKDLAKKFVIHVMDFTELLDYIKRFITLTRLLTTNNPNIDKLTNNNNLIRVTGRLVNSYRNASFVDINQLERDRQEKKSQKLRILEQKHPYLLRIPEQWLD